ncbi:MAG: NAD(P)/FAD-dependent oxidoreductase [bacterium]
MTEFVIIGFGAAGEAAAKRLKELSPDSKVAVISDEKDHFYYRLRLCEYISGKIDAKALFVDDAIYLNKGIDIVRNRAVKVQKDNVITEDGKVHRFDALLISTGGVPNRMRIPGSQLSGVFTLRFFHEAKEIKKNLGSCSRAVVVGGGILGMDIADALHSAGKDVTMLVREKTLGFPLLTPENAKKREIAMRNNGIDIHFEEELTQINGKTQVESVTTSKGIKIDADMVIVAIGIRPNVDFLSGGIINMHRGILINDKFQTNIPSIFAAGDVIELDQESTESIYQKGTWGQAYNQGRAAAENMLSYVGVKL